MKVPHIQSLGFELQDGSMIHVQGIIPHSANRFRINLAVAPDLNEKCEKCDRAFHLNPRFEGTNQVVRNSYLAGRWGEEERGGGFPLTKGSSFECTILCTAKEYRTVHMKRNMASGLYPGSVINVCGTPSNKFTINLSMKNAPNTDIALHFDVRFGQNVVVRNTFRNCHWEHEERQQAIMPFQRGVPFNIMILCEQHAFKISVNNVHFVEYSHRIKNLHDIKWLDILGELTLSDVRTP